MEAMTTSNGCGIVVRLQSFKFKFKDTLRKCTKKNTQNTVFKEIGCLFTVIERRYLKKKKKKNCGFVYIVLKSQLFQITQRSL